MTAANSEPGLKLAKLVSVEVLHHGVLIYLYKWWVYMVSGYVVYGSAWGMVDRFLMYTARRGQRICGSI